MNTSEWLPGGWRAVSASCQLDLPANIGAPAQPRASLRSQGFQVERDKYKTRETSHNRSKLCISLPNILDVLSLQGQLILQLHFTKKNVCINSEFLQGKKTEVWSALLGGRMGAGGEIASGKPYWPVVLPLLPWER